MNATELGTYGGVAARAFKLKGQMLKRGDSVTAEMLDGVNPRQRRSLQGAGYVTYYNRGDEKPQAREVIKATAKKASRGRKRKGGK